MLGLNHYMELVMFLESFQYIPPISNEKVTVRDATFNDFPVLVPKQEPESLRWGLFYIHSGSWCLGSTGKCDMLENSLYSI